MNKWPNSHLFALPREFFDHCPLILISSTLDFGPTPFKFFNSWLLNEDLKSIVLSAWSFIGISVSTHPATIFKNKLKYLKGEIKNWRAVVDSCNDSGLKSLKHKVDILDNKAVMSGLNSQEKEDRLNLMKNIMEMEALKIKDIKQKAKVKWVTHKETKILDFPWYAF